MEINRGYPNMEIEEEEKKLLLDYKDRGSLQDRGSERDGISATFIIKNLPFKDAVQITQNPNSIISTVGPEAGLSGLS